MTNKEIKREKEKIKIQIIEKINSGESSFDAFSEYILKLMSDKNFWLVEEVFNKTWGISIDRNKSINSMMRAYFNRIRIQTPSRFQMDYDVLLDTYDIYQIGTNFYKQSDNVLIGEVKETSEVDRPHYYDDESFLNKTREIKYNLVAIKSTGEQRDFIDFDPKLTSMVNLYQNYDKAFRFISE